MKLLNRTTYTYLILTFPIIVITMVLFYFLIRNFNLKHVENNLKEEHHKIIRKSQHIENYYIEDELSDELFVNEIPEDSVIKDQYSTIMVFDKFEEQYEPFRQLETMQTIAGKNYRILIRKSLVENTTLVYSISIAVFVLILVLAGSFILLNRFLSEKLWRPFYSILENLSKYHVGQHYQAQPKMLIQEFNTLDTSIQRMVKRVNKEYFVQKEFIDIISHEYQTPLAVIGNKAEMLMQNEHLNEEDATKLNRIIEYVHKLSKMNQSLLLLSRIDNNQFDKKEKTDVQKLFKQLVTEKQFQLDLKEITTQTIIHENCVLQMNTTLAGILFGNLLQNAIRHNLKLRGQIIFELTANKIVVSNTGAETHLSEEEMFEKFKKSSDSKQSIGLGLNIVKAICDHYGFEIHYSYNISRKLHSFSINTKIN